MSIEDEFWANVGGTWRHPCHPWLGGRSKGYGVTTLRGKRERAHRVAFELYYGRPPEGDVLHSCDNPICCNPKHLRDGTHQENMADMVARGRQAKGEVSGKSKFARELIDALRTLGRAGTSAKELAVMCRHQPSRAYIQQILNGKTWNWCIASASAMTVNQALATVRAHAQDAKTQRKLGKSYFQ